jgi:hypothetical protein
VAAALSCFGAQIVGCRLAYLKAPQLFEPDPLRAAFLHFADPARLAPVLATCTDLHGGAPGECEEAIAADVGLALELVRAAVSLSDVGRIIAGLDIDRIIEQMDEEAPAGAAAAPGEANAARQVSAMELLATGLAERFHVDPFAPWGWPYEAVLSLAKDILPALYPRPADAEKIFGLTADEWAARGVTLTPTEH